MLKRSPCYAAVFGEGALAHLQDVRTPPQSVPPNLKKTLGKASNAVEAMETDRCRPRQQYFYCFWE
jgi:hypothetical protein